MISAEHELALSRQVQLAGLMRRIDELHPGNPFAGSRMLRNLSNRELPRDGSHASEDADRRMRQNLTPRLAP